MRWLLPLSLLAFGPSPGLLAGTLTASLDRDTLAVGESVTLTLTFQDVNVQAPPSLPQIPNLKLAGIGAPAAFQMNLNGQIMSRISYSYSLVPTQPGEITIPAIPVSVGGQQLTTQPLKLKVQEAPPPNPDANKVAFLRLEVPKKEIYVGEALPVDINLFILEGRYAPPQIESSGFTVGKMLQQGQTRARVGNQVFNVVPFKTYVAAARSGPLTLGPVTTEVNTPKPNGRRTWFGEILDWQKLSLQSGAHNLNVLPLPTNDVPPTFTGAIGHFAMTETAAPTNIALGDPITVKVAINGQGLLDSITLPSQPMWTDFKVYPPNSRVDATDPFGLVGTKTFEQTVVPQKQETTTLPSFQFSFFDPTAKAYRTLSGPAFGLIVRPTAAVVLPGLIAQPTQIAITNDEIVRIKPYLGVSPVVGVPLIQQPWFLAVQGVPLLTWVSLLLVRKRNEALARNPRLRRQREVARKINDGLAELRRQATAQESDAFFATVFRLLQEQLGERLDLPASAITEAVIDERLRGRKIREQTLVSLHSLFQICNQARYAPVRSSHELTSLIERVETTLKELQTIPQ